jgi:hypothetical protein
MNYLKPRNIFGGRVSAFLLGAGTGSLLYYVVDSQMLKSSGKAHYRAMKVREELVGMISTPVKAVKDSGYKSLVTPLKESIGETTNLKSIWNNGVQAVYKSISKAMGN